MSEQENKGIAIIPQLAQLDHVTFANDVANNIKEGTVDPLMIHIFLKRFEAIQKVLKDDKTVQTLINKEASKHIQDGKTFDFLGAKLTLTSVYTVYDFTECNDPVWTSLDTMEKEIKELKKNREDMLKSMFPEKAHLFSIEAPVIRVDKCPYIEWGEIGLDYALNKPLKIQKEGIKVSFPKK